MSVIPEGRVLTEWEQLFSVVSRHKARGNAFKVKQGSTWPSGRTSVLWGKLHGCAPELPALGVPAWAEDGPDGHWGPWQSQPFYDSLIQLYFSIAISIKITCILLPNIHINMQYSYNSLFLKNNTGLPNIKMKPKFKRNTEIKNYSFNFFATICCHERKKKFNCWDLSQRWREAFLLIVK